MSITIRGKARFDYKVVLTTEEFAGFTRELVEASKEFTQGVKFDAKRLAVIQKAAQEGPEEAFKLALKMGLHETLRDMAREADCKISNIGVTA